ncbi:MAG: kelch repeat-containing protein [Bacteroidota bacterium]
MFRPTMWYVLASLFLFLIADTATLNAQNVAPNSGQLDAIWSTVATTNEPDARHENGFVAYNGKLYLIGGRGLKRVQIFDPATDTWTNGAFPSFQLHHFQALVYNNLIYVIGAYTGTCCDAESGVSHVWTYNPATDSWAQGDEIPQDRRRGSTGAVVYNDKIYIVGGIDGGHGDPATAYASFDEYDPNTGQWRVLPDAPRVRDHFHATVFNGKLYLIGGRDSSVNSITGATIGEIDVYDFGTNTWSTLPSTKNLPIPRGAPATLLYQGEILVIGGETTQTLAHNQTEAFNPITESCRDLAPLVVGRHATQAAIFDNAIYLAAGSAQKGGAPELDSIERYEDTNVQLIQYNQELKPGWNMAGLPITPTTTDYQSIYDDLDLVAGLSPLTWDGDNSYEAFTSLSIGKAFWIRLNDNAPNPDTQTITGTAINAMQISLTEGWNMIAGPSCDNVFLLGSSTDPTGAIPEGSLYLFDDGYEPAYNEVFARGRLDQGVGYWVFTTKDAILDLQCSGGKNAADAHTAGTLSTEQDAFGSLHVRNAAGKSQQLLFTDSPAATSAAYNLPPRADQRYFDARFRNNRRLLEATAGDIRVQAGALPLTLQFGKAPAGKSGQLAISYQTPTGIQIHDLRQGQSIEIHDTAVELVHMQFIDAPDALPDGFTLHGNYPNPFNPTTRISFDMPADGDVEIQVLDLLGREVLRESAAQVAAGNQRSVSIDARSLPAGTYVYRVTARLGSEVFIHSGSMVLLK